MVPRRAIAVAVLDANGVEHAAVVTASRGIDGAAVLAARNPARVDRLAGVAPYLVFEPEDDRTFWLPPASMEGRDLYDA